MYKKVVLVTGGARGIGKEICNQLGRISSHVALTYTKSSYLAEKLKRDLTDNNVSSSIHKLDITDYVMCNSVIDEVNQKYGSINILVNNAGITLNKQFINCNHKDIYNILNTNLQGVINMTWASLNSLIKSSNNGEVSRIINISSSSSLSGKAGQVLYSSSKGGVNGFTRLCARVLSSKNIIVNAISPGYISTDMTNNISKDKYDHILNMSAIKKVGNVIDIASVVKFLCDSECNYMTGQIIHVDGGKCC